MLATFDDVIERDDDAVEYRRVLKDTTARLGSPSTTTTTKTKSNITSHQPNDRVMNNVDIMSRIPNLHPLPGTAMVVVKRNKSNQIHHRRRRLRSTSASSSSTFTTSSPSPSASSSSSSLLSRSSHSYIFGRTKFQIVSFVTILLFANLFIINEAVSINGNSNHKRTGQLPQRFEMEPIDKTAVVGDTIILPCRVENKVGTLQWTRDGFGLGTERTLDGFQRYRMVGSDDEGDYSLEISPVALEDDAIFQCQVGALEGIGGIRSRSAAFTVQVPPESPVIVVTHAHSHAQVYKTNENGSGHKNGNLNHNNGEMLISTGGESGTSSGSSSSNDHQLRTTAGMTIELTCEAHGGRPPAELAWMDSAGVPITNGVQYSTTKLNDGKRWNAALKWTVVASRALDGQRVTCRSENAALKSPRYAHIQLEVRYAPEVELKVASSSDSGIVREGDDLTLECNAMGNPSRMTFKWSRDGVPLGAESDVGASGDGTPRLVFRRVGREFHGTVIACEVTNSVGTSRAKLEVKVAFKPRFVKPPESVIGIAKGETVRLECDVDSYPKAVINWSRFQPKMSMVPNAPDRYVDHWTEIGDGSTIEVSVAGRYRCIGKSATFDDEVKGETLVFIKGAPLIRSPSIQYGLENEPVRLQCMVEAIPPPTKITWYKLKPHQQILGVDNNEGYEILEEEDPEDFSMPSSSSLSSSASYLTSSGVGTSSSSTETANSNDESQWPLSSLALLRSIIYIRRAKESDFGQYNCSVWNQYGFQSQIITLQKQANILSPLVLTLSGILGVGVLFILIASLIVFACIRSQRLRQGHSLAPKKLDSTDGQRTGVGCATACHGSVIGDGTVDEMEKKINTLNSLEKNLLMKNTIMKMTNSNQVLATVANGSETPLPTYVTNGALPVYSEYEYNYAYPSNDLIIANGGVINNNPLPTYGYDNIAAYNYDYAMHDGLPQNDKKQTPVQITAYHPDTNNVHLYSTVMKPHLNGIDPMTSKAIHRSSSSSTDSPNYSSIHQKHNNDDNIDNGKCDE
ncbi:hypothetical protein BLOT_005317 [Blomia tropicalis]|nr:hypothetical protein BLOT_005317 [Blomia tropicalis]